MEKILFRRIESIFLFLSLVLFLVLSVIVYEIESGGAKQGIDEIIKQVEVSYEQSNTDTKEAVQTFEDDYLKKAESIDFMLNYLEEEEGLRSLNQLKTIMEIQSIELIDENGTIIASTDCQAVGLNLFSHEETKPFWDLIKGAEEQTYVIQKNATNIVGKEPMVYIGIKSDSEYYSVLQIGIKAEVLDKILDENSIDRIIQSMPTVRKQAVFLVDRETGELDGITRNNDQQITIKGVSTAEEFLFALSSYEKGKLVNINDSFKYIKTKFTDDKIIGVYQDWNDIYKNVWIEILELFAIIAIILGVTIGIFKHCIRKYVLQDLSFIESNAKKIMLGDYNVKFQTEHDTEFKQISKVLNSWLESYRYKSQRMTRIITTIDNHMAVFECLYPINKNFFTGNMQEILNVEDEVWDSIRYTPEQFQNYIDTLVKSDITEEKIIQMKNKYISIVAFKEEEEFYGMIIDRTDDMKKQKRIQNELEEIKIESETDSLTKLKNRACLEDRVKKWLQTNREQGIMLLFDLDNFKTINDQLGHPIGDLVLQKFAKCLQNFWKNDEIVARMGGDEFIVFIPQSMSFSSLSEKLNNLLVQIREELKDYKQYGLSVSIGASYINPKIHSYEHLYESADLALYTAKKTGKDNFCINKESIFYKNENDT